DSTAAPVEAPARPWTDYHSASGPVAPALAALREPVRVVRGVGPQRATELERFGLRTVEDVLYHLPFRYEDRRALLPLADLRLGEEATTVGEVARVHRSVAGRRHRQVLEVVIRDASGMLLLVWFHQIAYFARRFTIGQRLVVHGR